MALLASNGSLPAAALLPPTLSTPGSLEEAQILRATSHSMGHRESPKDTTNSGLTTPSGSFGICFISLEPAAPSVFRPWQASSSISTMSTFANPQPSKILFWAHPFQVQPFQQYLWFHRMHCEIKAVTKYSYARVLIEV